MIKVFLCHSSNDKPFVRRLTDELERFGIDVWLDERRITVGDSLCAKIEDGLSSCNYVAIVLSKSALKKPWVMNELRSAFNLEVQRKNKVILPILFEKTNLPTLLLDRKYADFSGDFDTAFLDLIGGIFGEDGGSSLHLQTMECTVTLDIRRVDGSVVNFEKKQKVEALRDGVDTYIEAFTADGEILDASITPGTIESKRIESGLNYFVTKFPKPLKKRQRASRSFRAKWINSFMSSSEYWEEKQDNPTKIVTIEVLFPKTRPPKTWSVSERIGVREIESTSPVKQCVIRNKPSLKLIITKPQHLRNYILRWEW